MSFGKASAPAPPNYAPIAQADAAAAQQEFQLGQDQLDWSKQQFNQTWPFAQQYLTSQIGATTAEQQAAQQQQDTYNSTYKPIEQKFADQATNYDSPTREDTQAGSAMADVANTFNANRNAATANLESFGIDPSQTRYQALDLSSRVSQAAATAAAGTQSRLNTQATGLALEGEAINTGRGYPSAVASAYDAATNAGSAGLKSANSTTSTASDTMGTPIQYGGLATKSLAGETSALDTGYSNAYSSAAMTNGIAANTAAGLGQLIGGAGAAAFMFSDRRLKTDVKRIGTADNGLPIYTFRYKGEDKDQIHVGVMADEAEIVHPESVITTRSGYKAVDYTRALEL